MTNTPFLDLLLQGRYLLAIGIVLMLIVAGIRSGIGAYVPWFTSKAGGYVLGLGSAFLLYIGAALRDGSGLSLSLLASALAAGWTAAGGWEHFRDFVEALRSGKPPRAMAMATLVLIGLMAAGCGPKTSTFSHAFWDCTTPERANAVAVVTPVVESLIIAAASADGSKIDTAPIKATVEQGELTRRGRRVAQLCHGECVRGACGACQPEI